MIALCKFEHTCFEGTRAPLLYTADEIIISNINLILFQLSIWYWYFRIYCRNSCQLISFPLVDIYLLWSSISAYSICAFFLILFLEIKGPCLFSRIQDYFLRYRICAIFFASRICAHLHARIHDLCLFSRI